MCSNLFFKHAPFYAFLRRIVPFMLFYLIMNDLCLGPNTLTLHQVHQITSFAIKHMAIKHTTKGQTNQHRQRRCPLVNRQTKHSPTNNSRAYPKPHSTFSNDCHVMMTMDKHRSALNTKQSVMNMVYPIPLMAPQCFAHKHIHPINTLESMPWTALPLSIKQQRRSAQHTN